LEVIEVRAGYTIKHEGKVAQLLRGPSLGRDPILKRQDCRNASINAVGVE
jgi:hypothetical protein